MFGVELLPLAEAQPLNFELDDLDWAGSTSQPEFSGYTEPCPEILAVASPAPASNSSGENSLLGTALPANWGVHILTLLSKNRDEPGENNSAASASGTASQAKGAQAQSQAVHHAQPDKASKQREKNKRAQKRHRDRQKVMLCMPYPSSIYAVSDSQQWFQTSQHCKSVHSLPAEPNARLLNC